jgi:hypothetical protein
MLIGGGPGLCQLLSKPLPRTPVNERKKRRAGSRNVGPPKPGKGSHRLPFGEPFDRLSRELDTRSWLIANDPGIVPRRNDVGVAGF